MNTQNLSPPLPPARIEHPPGSLDERIAQAEMRLVAREQAMRQCSQALLRRAREATEPRRMLRPALYALGTLALAWGAVRVLRGRPDALVTGTATAAAATPAVSSASLLGAVPWTRAIALLWPFLPEAWRGRLGPEGASLLVIAGLPLAGWLFSRRTHGVHTTPSIASPTVRHRRSSIWARDGQSLV